MVTIGRFTFFLLFLAILVHKMSSVEIIPRSVEIKEGEGFLAILKQDVEVPVASCQITWNNKMYFFSPGSNKSFVTPKGEVLHPFEFNNSNDCGVRVLNTSRDSTGQWKLTGIDENGSVGSAYIEVRISPKEDDPQSCPRPSSSLVNKCSKILMDSGIVKSCKTRVSEDYVCEYFLNGKMTKNTLLVERDKQRPTKFLSDPDRTILECSVATMEPSSAERRIKSCFIEHIASGDVYNIQEGLQDIRYSAYKTNFETGVCQFEIPKRILDHESGVWKMHIETIVYNHYYNGYDDPEDYPTNRTCTFHLVGNKTLATERLFRRTQSTITIKTMEDHVQIDCAKNVFYPLTICYLRVDNTAHLYDDYDQMLNGNCIFTVDSVIANWTCGFNGPTNDDPDFIQNFEIVKYDTEVIDEQMKRTANGTTTLECHHISQTNILACIFLSPNGKMYRLPSDKFNSTQFSYHGRGFSMGDCGIELAKEIEEPGFWQCVMKTDQKKTLSIDIWVEE